MLLLSLALGCAFDEELPQVDVTGTIVVPREAATRRILDAETGEISEVTDSRFIGPVYLGAFPSVNTQDYGYTHPEMGPVIVAEVPGNTYPYGGGSVGRFDFACFDYLTCRTPTGRFSDYDDLISFFRDVVGDPIQDQFGNEVDSAGYFQTVCYDLFEITADYEMEWISEVTYEGEKIDRLDFVENADGDFEAEFNLWRVNFQPGMQIWGWMDAPSDMFEGAPASRFSFATCDPNNGQTNAEYNNDIRFGVTRQDLLNYPGQYIGSGDWVVGIDQVWTVDAEDAEGYRASPPEIRMVLNEKVED